MISLGLTGQEWRHLPSIGRAALDCCAPTRTVERTASVRGWRPSLETSARYIQQVEMVEGVVEWVNLLIRFNMCIVFDSVDPEVPNRKKHKGVDLHP